MSAAFCARAIKHLNEQMLNDRPLVPVVLDIKKNCIDKGAVEKEKIFMTEYLL